MKKKVRETERTRRNLNGKEVRGGGRQGERDGVEEKMKELVKKLVNSMKQVYKRKKKREMAGQSEPYRREWCWRETACIECGRYDRAEQVKPEKE